MFAAVRCRGRRLKVSAISDDVSISSAGRPPDLHNSGQKAPWHGLGQWFRPWRRRSDAFVRHQNVRAAGKSCRAESSNLSPIPAAKTPCSTVTCSSVGRQCAATLPPSGILRRSENIPGLNGSPLRTVSCTAAGSPVSGGGAIHFMSPGVNRTALAPVLCEADISSTCAPFADRKWRPEGDV